MNGPPLPKPSLGKNRLTQVKSDVNMDDFTPLRSVYSFLHPTDKERTLFNFFVRNYNPDTPIDDMKKDPSFDLKEEQRRTRSVRKRSSDHTANTTASDDTVSYSLRSYSHFSFAKC